MEREVGMLVASLGGDSGGVEVRRVGVGAWGGLLVWVWVWVGIGLGSGRGRGLGRVGVAAGLLGPVLLYLGEVTMV